MREANHLRRHWATTLVSIAALAALLGGAQGGAPTAALAASAAPKEEKARQATVKGSPSSKEPRVFPCW